ncbi:MAG TPA: hypothetical protein VFE86_06620 [Ilumatobacteraceae bacterium]|nr:hypothetical protein [Ilumatobacteraceae bacterium]
MTVVVLHLIEVRMWQTWFGGAYDAWFMNDPNAGAFMIGGLFVVGVIAGGFYLPGPSMAFGAWIAMDWLLFWGPGGPGNLFPIVMVVGAVLIVIACWPATLIGKELRGLVTRPHATH